MQNSTDMGEPKASGTELDRSGVAAWVERFRSRTTIRQKLNLFTACALALLALLVAVVFAANARIQGRSAFKDEIYSLVTVIEETRIAEKSFLQLHTNALRQLVVSQFAAAMERLDRLKGNSELTGLADHTQRYHDTFIRLAAAYDQRVNAADRMATTLAAADKAVSGIISILNVLQADRQMEGKELNDTERELQSVTLEAKIILLRLQVVQQAFLLSGDEKLLAEFDQIIQKASVGVLESMNQFAKAVKRDELLTAAAESREQVELAVGLGKDVLDLFKKENLQINALEEIGKKTLAEADAVLLDADRSVARIRWIALVVMTILLGCGVVLGLVISKVLVGMITGEIGRLVTAAEAMSVGDLDQTIEVSTQDELGKLAAAFRKTMDSERRMAQVATTVGQGDMSSKITPRSDKDVLALALQKMSAAIRHLVTDVGSLGDAAVAGNLSTRADASQHQGDFARIILGVNSALDALTGPMKEAVRYVDRISKGDIPEAITVDYRGDFNTLKKSLNVCIHTVKTLVTDVEHLSNAAVEGRLAIRADATRHQGEFRKLVEGMNATLSTLVGHLDAMPLPVMSIDTAFAIQYVNPSASSLLGRAPRELLGTKCYDQFQLGDCHTDRCACVRAMKEGRTAHGETTARPNGKSLEISYSGVPVRDDAGKVFGAFEVIVDQTAIQEAARAAEKVAGYQVQETQRVTAALDALSRGETQVKVEVANGDSDTARAHESFCAIAQAIERCGQAVRLLVSDADLLSRSIVEGKLATRVDLSRHQGDYRKVIEGVNRTLDAVVTPLRMAATYVEQISRGDIPNKITEHYSGDFDSIQKNLNQCITAIGILVDEVGVVIRAGREGNLSQRANADRTEGIYQKILRGMNDTLEAMLAPVTESAQVLENLAQRDLVVRMRGDYRGDHAKIKESLNATAEALHDALKQVADSVRQVSSASEQIAASSQTVASGAAEQASSIERTVASLQTMIEKSKRSAEDAQKANALARTAKGAADEGTEAMAQMQGAMGRIRASAEGTSQIIKDINEIAFQTNLLALNAAVEAARAGEAGRGFAVVAEEVRALALRSKEAASKTEELIRQSVKETEDGALTTRHVNEKLGEITQSVGKVTDIVIEIAAAAKDLASGIEQVNLSVDEMNKVTQQNAASSEQSSSAAQELSAQAGDLTQLVDSFNLERSVTIEPIDRPVLQEPATPFNRTAEPSAASRAVEPPAVR